MAKSNKQSKTVNPISDRAAKFQEIKTQYGDVGRKIEIKPVDQATCLRSPSAQLNILTNEVGFRPGSIVEYFGLEGTMKTWLALQMAKAAQEQFPDQAVAYIDPETAVDLYVAEHSIGINMDMLDGDVGLRKFEYFPSAEDDLPTLEDILNRIYAYAASGLFSLIILDSVAAASTLWEASNADITAGKVGGPSIPMSKGFKKIKAVCSRTGTRVWCINQVRTKFISTPTGQITKIEPGGGYALRFAATHRFHAAWVKKERESDGSELNIFAEKVKYGPPYRSIEVPFLFGIGVDSSTDLVNAAAKAGVLKKSGTWYSYDGNNIGQGAANTGAALAANPELFKKIENDTYAILCPPPTEDEITTPDSAEELQEDED